MSQHFLLIILVSTLYVKHVASCSCLKTEFKSQLCKVDVVAKIAITDASQCKQIGARVLVYVSKVYKTNSAFTKFLKRNKNFIEIDPMYGTSCNLDLKPKANYLIAAKFNAKTEFLTMGLCDLVQPWNTLKPKNRKLVEGNYKYCKNQTG